MDKRQQLYKSEHAQSLVEFAVGMVILLVLVVGITDTARALFTYLSMRDAAQEGALYASINPSSDTGTCSGPTDPIIQRVCSTSNLMSGLGASITVSVAPTVSGELCLGETGGVSHGMVVTIDYPSFPLTMPLLGAIIGSQTVAINASAENKILSPKCP